MTYLKKLLPILFIVFFSSNSFASCIAISDNDIEFLAQGSGDCTDKANNGILKIYYNRDINNGNDSFNDFNTLISGKNNKGYSMHFTFDRDGSAALSGEQILFAAYENYDDTTPIAKAGIRSGVFFYETGSELIDSIDMSELGDNTISNPHTAIIVYDESRNKIILNIDGAEVTSSNINPIAVSKIEKIEMGQDYVGKIGLLNSYKTRMSLRDRMKLNNLFGKIHKSKFFEPSKDSSGILRAAKSDAVICRSGKEYNESDKSCDIRSYSLTLPANAIAPTGSIAYNAALTSSNLGTITCDTDYNASTSPALGYYFDNAGDLQLQGTCDSIITLPDLSAKVDAQIGESSGLDSIEANLKLWLDGANIDKSDNSTLTNNDAIATWYDLSGNDNDATQTTASNRAIFESSTNSLDFDGSNDFYDIGTNITTGTSYTVFVVEKRESSIANNYFIGQNGSNTTNGNVHLGYRSDNTITLAHYANDQDGLVRTNGNTDLSVFRFKNGQSPSHFINYNGPLITSGQTGSALINSGNNYVGKTSTTSYYNGDIKEILIFNSTISDSDVIKINYYLSQKWGLVSSMDSDGDGTLDSSDSEPMNPAIPAAPTIVFSDNFNSDISGWSNVVAGGSGFNFQHNNGRLYEGAGSGSGYARHNMGGNASLTEYTISVRVRSGMASGGWGNNGIGIVFGESNSSNYYITYWHNYGPYNGPGHQNWSGYRDFRLAKKTGGSESTIRNISNLSISSLVGRSIWDDANFYFDLSVEVSSSGISVKIDGMEQFTHPDQPALGNVGLWTNDNDQDIAYDDFVITVP